MADFSLSRSTRIQAAPERVHALVDDFHEWQTWSPWEGLDPDMDRQYSGPDHGVGSRYRWAGNRKAGEGEMTITESTPTSVVVDLVFLKPFKATNVTSFDLVPAGDATDVTWTMTGSRNADGGGRQALLRQGDRQGLRPRPRRPEGPGRAPRLTLPTCQRVSVRLTSLGAPGALDRVALAGESLSDSLASTGGGGPPGTSCRNRLRWATNRPQAARSRGPGLWLWRTAAECGCRQLCWRYEALDRGRRVREAWPWIGWVARTTSCRT